MIYPEDRRRRSSGRLSPEPKQRTCSSLLAHQALGSSGTQTLFHHWSSRSWHSMIKKWIQWQQFLWVILKVIPENKRNVYFLKWNIMWNCWKPKQLTPSFNLGRRFSLILYCPVTYTVAWKHRESTTSLDKTLLTKEDCLRSADVTALSRCLSQTLLRVWDRDGDEGARVQLGSSASWFLEEQPKRRAQGQAESLRRELLCFIAAWEGSVVNLAPLWLQNNNGLVRKRGHHKLWGQASGACSIRVFLLAAPQGLGEKSRGNLSRDETSRLL